MSDESCAPISITQPTLLLVEGREEEFFFEALKLCLRIESLQIKQLGGKSTLPAKIAAIVNTPGFSSVVSLGIVRDADKDPKAAFQSICGALKKNHLPVPAKPGMPAGPKPLVWAFVLPAHDKCGALEDACLDAVSHDPAMRCVEQYFECLRSAKVKLDLYHLSKAKMQAFLASRTKAGLRLGEAAAGKYMPWKSPAFRELIAFTRSVASTTGETSCGGP